VNDEWQSRIETKLDRISETLAAHIEKNKAVSTVVEELKTTTVGLKTTQDQQRGAISLVVVLSLVATIAAAFFEGARFMGGH
jgi:hypothetical protein